MTSLAVKEASNPVLMDLQNTHQLCQMLMKTPHYAKMGPEGVFAIVETAKSLDIDPRQALGGGLYYVKGKVEMSARLMNSLIRAQKHSITRDKRSDDSICILHGKRADNGDTWTESFSMADAQRAGLANNAVWKNFARDMLFARALSRLARQLFPDVIGNVYVEGEISLDANIQEQKVVPVATEPVAQIDTPKAEAPRYEMMSEEAIDNLDSLIGGDHEYRKSVLNFIEKNYNAKSLYEMPKDIYGKVYERALKNYEAKEAKRVQEREAQRNNFNMGYDQYGEVNQMAVGGAK